MISSETWGVAIDALRANKVKAALTMLGVIIGSACIVLVVTIALIGKNYVIAQIEGVGSNLVYAYHLGGSAHAIADEISVADLDAVRELPHVVEVAGTHDSTNSNIVVNGKEKPVALIGVTQGFQKIRNLLILKGRFFDDVDMQTAAKACLITQDLANQYHRGHDRQRYPRRGVAVDGDRASSGSVWRPLASPRSLRSRC